MRVILSSELSHDQSEGCVHVLSSWLPAHDWEVTVQLLVSMAGPDCEALTVRCHQAHSSVLLLERLVSFLVRDWTRYPDPRIRELYPHTQHGGIFKRAKWRLQRMMKGDLIRKMHKLGLPKTKNVMTRTEDLLKVAKSFIYLVPYLVLLNMIDWFPMFILFSRLLCIRGISNSTRGTRIAADSSTYKKC